MSRWIIILTLLLAVVGPRASAQTKSYAVAVLAPLYLDSAFDASGAYKLGKQSPRFAFSGLEFAEGARLALDTLQTGGARLQCTFYDIRSAAQAIPHLIETHQLDSVQLIIASVSGGDYQTLAAFARMRSIPFISATWPNEGGVTANPFVCVLNPTIFTHCETIYHFIRVNHPTHQILYIRKPGPMEDKLEGYFKQLNDNLLPIQTVMTSDTLSAATLLPYLDSNRYAVIVCGSLDDAFGISLVRACTALSDTYPMTLIGMPTWEGNRTLESPELKNMPYLYTSPFLNPDIDSGASFSLTQRFIALTRTKPGDMAFRGYESTYLFANLLLRYGNTLMSHAGDAWFQTYTPYLIKPVFLTPGSAVPDYFENKHVYVLRRQNGAVARLQ
ncbi:ABC transporter substrate-binding protein [Dinghuibacter silviterrae]|uniref:ABC-type branched-subunit amino acid transport system substrate-binding protein n=1 Tax=Dinghuibacter silviterrae TaxID=1539049 RepID=A0A4R8DRV5_9BACT|nr:ABC transporter substrate-binding protein [Dinghuibacter silviterrae]TDX00576.1 ABC-type branched-subunit amino acid transport system substrate-binding protein [Dinghuibacter silviterrae]